MAIDPTVEPENLTYVAVLDVHLNRGVFYHRDDDYARAENQPERNWRLVSALRHGEYGSDLAWKELVELGPIAYVGAFVDRRHTVTGTPWAGTVSIEKEPS